jgi:Glycosyltransferase family 87
LFSRAPDNPLSRAHFWPLELALGLLPFSLLGQALVWAMFLPLGLHAKADFRQLYTGGYMILTGHASELYDFDAQMRFQQMLFPKAFAAGRLLITHPAFEELIFVPLSLLTYRSAFWIFFAINIAALALTLRLLWTRILPMRERWKWAPIMLTASFFPISRALLQGQDSILVLLLLACVMVLIERGKLNGAGLILGLGVFRFEIIMPIALLFLLWRQIRLVTGFLISAATAALVSIAIVGLRGAEMYLKYMLAISLKLSSETAMAKYSDSPLEMLNLRGLISALLWNRASHTWIEISILVASALVIAMGWRMKPSISVAIVAASLVSYHFIAHDASIWLIPIFLALSGTSISEGAFAAMMLFSPFAAVLIWEFIHSHAYLGAIPLLGLFVVQFLHRGKSETRHSDRIEAPPRSA